MTRQQTCGERKGSAAFCGARLLAAFCAAFSSAEDLCFLVRHCNRATHFCSSSSVCMAIVLATVLGFFGQAPSVLGRDAGHGSFPAGAAGTFCATQPPLCSDYSFIIPTMQSSAAAGSLGECCTLCAFSRTGSSQRCSHQGSTRACCTIACTCALGGLCVLGQRSACT